MAGISPDSAWQINRAVKGAADVDVDPEWRPVVDRIIACNGTGNRAAALVEALAGRPDGDSIIVAVWRAESVGAAVDPFRTYSASEMVDLPSPEFVIEDVLVESTLAEVAGDRASLKSFLVLDMALCIAAGIPWHGHAVRQGPVRYVLGEGAGGIGPRLRAWQMHNGRPVSNDLHFIKQAVIFGQDTRRPADNPDLDRLRATLDAMDRPPVLLVLDTLARMMGSGNENDTRDMGALIRAADGIRSDYGCIVLFVHHLNRAGTVRGNSALGGALDTEIVVKRTGDSISLENTKQKEFAEFRTLTFRHHVIDLGTTPKGRAVSSLALSLDDYQPLSAHTDSVLSILKEFGSAGAAHGEWRDACVDQNVSKSTFRRARLELVDETQTVVLHKRRYYPADQVPS